MKKIIFGFLLIVMLFIGTLVLSAAVNTTVEIQSVGKATVKITSDEEIHELKLYKKIGNSFILFYKAENDSLGKEVTVTIQRHLLSTESSTTFKAVVNSKEDGLKASKEFEIEKISEQASMNPEEVEKPSWTPVPIPSFTPPSVHPSEVPGPSGTDNIDGIKLDPNSLTLKVGESKKLSYKVTPEGKHPSLTWRTDATEICSVASDGTITGKSVGVAQISVKSSNGVMDICDVTVEQGAAPSSSSSPAPSSSEQPGPSSSEQSTPNPDVPQEVGIKLSNSVMMVDNKHYNFAVIKAYLSKEDAYKGEDVTWTIEDTNVAAISKDDNYLKTTTGGKVRIRGIGFGDTVLTAKLPNGKEAKCKIKVIISSWEKAPDGDIAAPATGVGQSWEVIHHTEEHPYWVRKESKDWGTEYVEAYINNAAKIVKEHPDYDRFKSEAAKKTIYGYTQSDLKVSYKNDKISVSGHIHDTTKGMANGEFEESKKEKQELELSPNGYIILFTAKNQWLYLLKLQDPDKPWNEETNRYQLLNSHVSSGGYYRDHFQRYITHLYNSNFGVALAYAFNDVNESVVAKGSSSHLNAFHSSDLNTDNTWGRPSSHGCIHIGTYNGENTEMYYRIIHDAGLFTRVIDF